MLPQGVLGFQYEADRSSGGLTSLAGLPLYLDLIEAIGLGAAIRQHVHVAGAQGWLDIQMVLALIFLNLAGGDCVEDLERLEADSGFAAVLRAIERDVLSSTERRLLKKRWRRPRERTVPSPSAASAWLERFHDPAAPKAVAGTAVIPDVTEQLRGLWQVNQALLGCIQTHQPATSATLDVDATLIETHKRDALPCYKGFKACQPLNCWWVRTGHDLVPGVPRWECSRRARATAGVASLSGASAGERDEGFIMIGYSRLSGRVVALLWGPAFRWRQPRLTKREGGQGSTLRGD